MRASFPDDNDQYVPTPNHCARSGPLHGNQEAASRAGYQAYQASQGQDKRATPSRTQPLPMRPGLDLAWSVSEQPAPGVGDAVRAAADGRQVDERRTATGYVQQKEIRGPFGRLR